MKNISLYDYQEQMRQRIREALSEENGSLFRRRRKHVPLWGRSVMVQMPTGTGKTYLMAAVVDDFLSGRVGEEQACVWIIAHRRELVEQVENALIQLGIKSVSAQEVGGKGTVKVMSIQWLSRHYGEMKDRPSLIVVDEAHHALAATYQDLWGRYPEALKLGLTATPCRMQKKGFTTLFDNLLTSWNIDEFIRRGYLALYDYVVINRESEDQLMIDSLEKRGADGDFSVPEMSQKLNSLPAIMRLYHSVEQYAKGKKGIVYAIDISHARRIAEYYAAQGLKAVAIDSKTPAALRKKMVADFKAGCLDCIVNVNLFDEGFDCPEVEFIQMARPTLSLSKYMQMIGRGLRVHPDKRLCVLIDNAGLYRSFGLPDAERDWVAMFVGETVGKGYIKRRLRNEIRTVNNEMDVVANHSRLCLRSETEREKYFEKAEPFEKDGRWGLRVGNDVILRPVYRRITPFVGKYSTYELSPNRRGVLLRNGRPYIQAQFRSIEILPNGDSIMTRSEISKRKVHLDTTLTDTKDLWEWWGS